MTEMEEVRAAVKGLLVTYRAFGEGYEDEFTDRVIKLVYGSCVACELSGWKTRAGERLLRGFRMKLAMFIIALLVVVTLVVCAYNIGQVQS